MKVLTDWSYGDPPCKGRWLTRISKHEFGGPSLLHWDGLKWLYDAGHEAAVQNRQWCGLAFNPESATRQVVYSVFSKCMVSALVVEEFTR